MDTQEQQVPSREATLGEKRVRRNFNPGGHLQVEDLKATAARFIDYCETMKGNAESLPQSERGEFIRLLSLAQTQAEDAAMWAVKAVTTPGLSL